MKNLVSAFGIVVAALREIFDEAPYARFLQRAKVPSSPAAYAAFCDECQSKRARQSRCC